MNNVELSPEMIRKLENGREYRNVRVQELRALDRSADDESYIVEGYATTFNQVYRLYDGEYYKIDEQIDARAFDDADMSDVIVQYNHEGRVFARTRNNTLQLTADDHGLHCRIDLGGTEIGRQLYEEIKGGYTDKMSFGFTVAEDQRTETENHETGTVTILRTITRIKNYSTSLP